MGTAASPLQPEAVDTLLAERRQRWLRPRPRHHKGILSLYSRALRQPHGRSVPGLMSEPGSGAFVPGAKLKDVKPGQIKTVRARGGYGWP